MKLRFARLSTVLVALGLCLSMAWLLVAPSTALAQPEPAEGETSEAVDGETADESAEESPSEEPIEEAAETPAEESATEAPVEATDSAAEVGTEEVSEEATGEHAADLGGHESGAHAASADGHSDAHGNHGASAGHGVVPHGTNDSPAEVKFDLALWSFVVFMLLLAILWKFAWGPIVAGLDKRENHIAGMIKQAEDNAETSRRQLAEHEAKLAGAHEEIRQMLDTAHREAETQKQEILAEAQRAAANEKDRALREIGAAKDSALGEIAQKSVDEAFSLASKIVRRELNPQEHQQLVQDAIGQFPSSN